MADDNFDSIIAHIDALIAIFEAKRTGPNMTTHEHTDAAIDTGLLRAALLLVLDHVDYMHGACSLTEAVGAALPVEVIERARAALEATQA